MRKFCDDEGYDYHKFCHYVRQGAYLHETATESFIEIDDQNLEQATQNFYNAITLLVTIHRIHDNKTKYVLYLK